MDMNVFIAAAPVSVRAQIVDLIARRGFTEHCYQCKREHSAEILKTPAGWAESQISGMCELCWNELFKEENNLDIEDLEYTPGLKSESL